MNFSSLNVPEAVLKGIEAVGFTKCTPIQEATIPLALKGKDVAGQAQTGTGKTAAFLIVLFSRLMENPTPRKLPRALVIAPSRELVAQIYQDAMRLGQYTNLTMTPVFGGIDYKKQANILQKGVDIVIGTPGRLIDYYKQKVFSLKHIKALVVDEADRMFDMGFIRDIRYIMRNLPAYHKRQSLLFSATLSNRVMELAYEHMNLPKKIVINPKQITVDKVEQSVYHVGKYERFSLLMGILKTDGCERTMIFSNTRREVQQVTDYLKANHYQARAITGDLPQKKRMRILEDFKEGRLPILVATDVASRGIHVNDITHVINYCLPQDREDYIHRIGRTARAGATGKAISLVCEDCALYLEHVERFLKKKIPVVWPEDDFFSDYKRPPRKRLTPRKESVPGKEGRKRRPPRKRTTALVKTTSSVESSGKNSGDQTPNAQGTKKKRRRRRAPCKKRPGAATTATTASP